MRIRDSVWKGQVLCGVHQGSERALPFPAEHLPDLIEHDGEPLPNEVPCGQVMVGNLQRHLKNLTAASILTSFLTTLESDGTLLHRMTLFCGRRGYVQSYPALEVMDDVAA